MKKHNTRKQAKRLGQTIGLDLGDRTSRYCVLDRAGVILTEGSVAMTKKSLAQQFGSIAQSRIALEVGTHSPWVSRHLKALGHEVIVANSRRVRLISESSHKNDKMDARTLARLARVDPELLSPIQHRSEQAQEHLTVIRARAALVEARTRLINTARGLAEASGERLKSDRRKRFLPHRQECLCYVQRIAGFVVGDLESQKRVDCFHGIRIGCRDSHAAAVVQRLVGILDLAL